MDAKVHLARPDHRNEEERIGLVRRDLRLQRADESVDQVADHHLGVAARRNFREPFPALGRGFHLSALADVVPDDFLARRAHSAKLPPGASADRELVAPVVAVEKVVGRPVKTYWVGERPDVAHLAGATAPQIEVRQVGAEAWAQSLPQS
jgi:hypothetical protein